MKIATTLTILFVLSLTIIAGAGQVARASSPTYNIDTLAGKLASVDNTPGLYISMSGFAAQEADTSDLATNPSPDTPITPSFVLTSPLDGVTVAAPDVTVNQDTAAASQNEPVIAVDPNNPSRIVAAANDYVTRTWTCFIGSTPCSALGDGYSGTYFSNDGGSTWCCVATDPQHIGTLIPGVEHLVGGQYDAGGDPNLAFDVHGNVYYSGLGFDRLLPPNTVAVNKGSFDSNGNLQWGAPVFIGQTESPAILNDKPWSAVDTHASSPFLDRVYISWTRFIFNPANGAYVQSPIMVAFSSDGGQTFSDGQLIVSNVLFDQGSHIVVGSDGTVYVFWLGHASMGTFNSVWMAKSTDGGESWSMPVAVAPAVNIISPFNAVFRDNSFPAGDVAPNGDLYAAWSSEVLNTATTYSASPTCAFFISGTASVYANCHASVVWSKSSDGGASWTSPQAAFAPSTRTAIGYPVTQPNGGTLNAPASRPVDTLFPAVAVSPSGKVYVSAYAADVVSPWQRCAKPIAPPVGRINCLGLDNYINNAKLDYVVADLTTGVTQTVTTHPINTRYHFGGGFIGDYTDLAVGSDNVFHAIWADTNNVQTVVWWYGFQFVPTPVHQQDVVTASGNF